MNKTTTTTTTTTTTQQNIYTIKINNQDIGKFYTDLMLANKTLTNLKRHYPKLKIELVKTGEIKNGN